MRVFTKTGKSAARKIVSGSKDSRLSQGRQGAIPPKAPKVKRRKSNSIASKRPY